MTEENSFGTTFNKNLTSSLKYYNFDGMTKQQIIEKYESLLFEREKQIGIISLQMGNVHEKLMNLNEELEVLQKKKNQKDESVIEKQTELNQVLREKDHIFNKLNNLIEENDKFKKIIQSNSTTLSLLNNDEKDKIFDKKKRGKSLNDKRYRRISTKTMDEYNKRLSINQIKKMNTYNVNNDGIKSPDPIRNLNIKFSPIPIQSNNASLNLIKINNEIPIVNNKNQSNENNKNDNNKNNNEKDENKNNINNENNIKENNKNDNLNENKNIENENKNEVNNNNNINSDIIKDESEIKATTPIVKLPKRHHKKKDKKKTKKLASDDLDYEPVFK